MKLKKEFISHVSGGENLLVPTGGADFIGIVKGNATAGVIFGYLSEETTEEEIIARMRERFDAPEGVIERDVKKVLSQLREIGALDG